MITKFNWVLLIKFRLPTYLKKEYFVKQIVISNLQNDSPINVWDLLNHAKRQIFEPISWTEVVAWTRGLMLNQHGIKICTERVYIFSSIHKRRLKLILILINMVGLPQHIESHWFVICKVETNQKDLEVVKVKRMHELIVSHFNNLLGFE